MIIMTFQHKSVVDSLKTHGGYYCNVLGLSSIFK